MTVQTVSKETQSNWWLDTILASSALGAMLSGIYFLYFPVGGYKGGRNPLYDIQILFDRHTWEDVHTWAGLAMIIVAFVHLAFHWTWVVSMTRRVVKEAFGKASTMNRRARFNLWLNASVALSFLLTAVSGVVFLFLPSEHTANGLVFLFSATTWDLIHTWAGIALIATAVTHFIIHWKWVTKVTAKMWARLVSTAIHKNNTLESMKG